MADGDLFINSAGRAETIEGANKASQDIAESLLTPLDASRAFGSELADLNVPQPVRNFAGRGIISKKVDEAIQRLIRLQNTDTQSTADERIEKINRIIVNQINSTDFVFWVSVLLEDRSVLSDQLLGVSLRHQSTARFSEAIEERVRAEVGLP